jgi:putative SOS response-associated peptidase YedK
MCGRYTLHCSAAAVANRFGVSPPSLLPQRYNIAPSQRVLAIRQRANGKRELVPLSWGLVPFWADDPTIGNRLINARAETAATKPAFRRGFASRRCLIVADGFYEWQAEGRHKQPWYIQLASGQPFGFAGLWERWEKGGTPIQSCTVLTCPANSLMQPIHNRMPVILPAEHEAAWLDSNAHDTAQLSQLLKPLPAAAMTAYRVGSLVNSPRLDTAGCIQPLPESGGNAAVQRSLW